MTTTKPYLLYNIVQRYPWGRTGAKSIIARLRGQEDSEETFAELWIGGHKKAPSEIMYDGSISKISDILANNAEEFLGKRVLNKFGREFPFLFKILSIAEPLSIQAHPGKALARELHAKDSNNYPDENHKPEASIALSEVELLYGFKPKKDLIASVKKCPELLELLSVTFDEFEKLSLKEICLKLFKANKSLIQAVSKRLYNRLALENNHSLENEWVTKLSSQYPEGDIGIYFFYLLNLVTLDVGESIFIGPNILHAYLSGEMIECMATSDNVVRAGLTAKYIDTETLVSMLSYEQAKPSIIYPISSEWQDYSYDAEEFVIHSFKGSTTLNGTIVNESPQILILLSGQARILFDNSIIELLPGDAYLIPATLKNFQVDVIDGQVFRALVP